MTLILIANQNQNSGAMWNSIPEHAQKYKKSKQKKKKEGTEEREGRGEGGECFESASH